ncbi:MAG: hypothetical protein ACLFTA_02845, partial [Candidatus Nanohaloarchaea archaeon]
MRLEKIRKESSKKIKGLEMPESIRTPGRTWTRYPENLEEKITDKENIEPEIETEGDVEVFTGDEALEKAGEKAFNLIKSDENRLNALHAANINSMIYAEASGEVELHVKYKEKNPVISHLIIDAERNSN